MTRVMLLNPPFVPRFNRTGCRWASKTRSDTVCYPSWLAYATGYLEMNGVEVKLIDAPACSESLTSVIQQCREFNPDVIVIDTATTSIANDVKVAKVLKTDLPKAEIVMVGPHASALPEETLEASGADYVVKGEYMVVIQEILEGNHDHGVVQGIPFDNLDELTFISKTYKKHLKIEDYFFSLAKYPEIQIMTQWGCKHFCNYCVWTHVLTGRNVRKRSVNNVVDELEWISENLPQIKDIILEDDTFTDDIERVVEICDEIIRRGLKLSLIANARANVPYLAMVKMKKAGFHRLIVGYEHGDQNILNFCRKGITIEQMKKFAEDAKRAKMEVMGCFMVGLFGETRETAQKTYDLAVELDPDFYFFSPATPFPGTVFYDLVKDRFLTAKRWEDWVDEDGFLKNVVSYPEFSDVEIRETIDKFMIKFAFRPKFIKKASVEILKDPVTEIRRWWKIVRGGLEYFVQDRNS